jgi:hypothetical protein
MAFGVAIVGAWILAGLAGDERAAAAARALNASAE